MDSTDLARVLEVLRREADCVENILRQWAALPDTPGWAGPAEQAAWVQQSHAGADLRKMSDNLEAAIRECARRLESAREAERHARELLVF